MGSDNNPNKRWIILILVVPLMIVVGVLKWKRLDVLREGRQEARQAERIAKIREDPLAHVWTGTDVALVERALGPGQRHNVDGADMRVWDVAGKGTFVATIKDGKVDHRSQSGGSGVTLETAIRLHLQSRRVRRFDQPQMPQQRRGEQEPAEANEKPPHNKE